MTLVPIVKSLYEAVGHGDQWRFNDAGLVSLFRQRHDRRPQGLASAARGRVIPFTPDNGGDGR